MAIKRVVLIRPGETDWNRLGRWQGWVDSPLNEHGKSQAAALAKFVRNIGLTALYSSDLRRAVQTSEILAEQLGFSPILDSRWRERDIGKWQGMTIEEIRDWHVDAYRELQADVYNFRVPGGESRNDVKKRVAEAFNGVLADDKGTTVGIISHTTSTHMLLDAIISGYDVYTVVLGNTSVTTIALNSANQWELVASNDLAHLEGLSSMAVGELEKEK